MRIPLDYYRILCVPAKATTAQITQAYRDRLSQMPRREHGALAIEARNRIIEQAFDVLSQTESRAVYDHELSGNLFRSLVPSRPKLPFPDHAVSGPPEIDPHQPTIAIEERDFLGGLLLLLDLGEYELILKLASPYLRGKGKQVKGGSLGDPDLVNPELRLCLALAHWELSREQWLQQHYELAATSGQAGQTLLADADLFPELREEIQAELNRLRPYQILELLSLTDGETAERKRGLAMLQDMLDARGGIDGQGDDKSGLGIDDFLRFIQQLRSYLTVQEQLDLFVAESKRPSAAATYLAVYGLLGAGFSWRQPQLVLQAQELLERLGQRQDVYLEQSICALLLGQPDEANQLLEQSQEQEAIAYIREQSQGAANLLPGLCLYSETWLKTEVFSHFRDLRQRRDDTAVSLKAYFADLEVQQYLEGLPIAPPPEPETAPTQPQAAIAATVAPDVNSAPLPSRPEKVTSFEALVSESAPTMVPDVSPGVMTPPSPPEPEPVIETAETGPSHRSFSVPFLAIAVALGAVVALVGLVQLITRSPSQETASNGPTVTTPAPEPETPVEPPEAPIIENENPTPILDEAIATEVIENWFTSKSQAFGPDHDLTALENILTNPSLAEWRSRAQQVRDAGHYRTYEHSLTVESFNFDPSQPDVATVEAQVQEKANHYRGNGALDASQSYDSSLQIRYSLVRLDDRWLIRSSQTL
ncbi:IMS domain-containing protein [Picosynechococcus sp. NKBG15041c]|uniref:IMS domain-containing protein n=1 Tax=Picosynechococcus sp. NKBG15041c TaxID=1407650 RepID=UPI000417053F|nr:IMS domain-containing protein [Picosynechococcus sp. NKBG15041c]